jgi:FkbH-like protein
LARENVSYTPIRIAILGGSTVDDIKNVMELFLLESGIKPDFYQSDYNKFYEDAVFGNVGLDEFQPEIVIVFTSLANIANWPNNVDDRSSMLEKLMAEYRRFATVWDALKKRYNAIIIQNNFDLPCESDTGSLSAVTGRNRFVSALNEKIAAYAEDNNGFYIHDLNGLSARIGLRKWHNHFQYFAYKFAMDYDIMPEVSLGLARIIRAILGKVRKCLILDLDNTLWGGIIGDDGAENIQIGHETPAAEAFTYFQEYVLRLKERGVILAVCSKNEEDIAKSGFAHPDSVLKLEDFAAFKANWTPKNENIVAIAKEINIGLDSLVFIDDNPAEREIVRRSLPDVAVPEVDGTDVFSYIRAIEEAGYFETVAVSADDLKRNENYQANRARQELSANTASYDDFLKSLTMKAEIDEFKPVYFDRIAQLTGKTNQFNLTTRRYTRAEIENMAGDSRYLTLYGRLADKFGDNGLISVIIGEKRGAELHILLWLMSCRVLKRGMEESMLDVLAEKAKAKGCTKLIGYYYPTKKNKMVASLYESFGFVTTGTDSAGTIWEMPLENYKRHGKYIYVWEGME